MSADTRTRGGRGIRELPFAESRFPESGGENVTKV